MIYHSSEDPVLIKKISLKVWTLRDEIECQLIHNLKKHDVNDFEHVDQNVLKKMNIDRFKGKYENSRSVGADLAVENNVIELNAPLANPEMDLGEEAMRLAMEDTATDVENSPEISTPPHEDGVSNESNDNVTSIDQSMVLQGQVTDSNTDSNMQPSIDVEDEDELEEKEIQKLNSENTNVIYLTNKMPPIPTEKIARAKTILTEINMNKIFFFSDKAFLEGQTIVIKFEIPRSFIVHAEVAYARPFSLKSRVISQNNYRFRIVAKFTFMKEGERALLRQFLTSIEPEKKAPTKQAENKAETSSDDDFSELDDLI